MVSSLHDSHRGRQLGTALQYSILPSPLCGRVLTRSASEVMSRCLCSPPLLDRPPGIFLSLYLSVQFFVPSSIAGLLRNPTVARQIKLRDVMAPFCLSAPTDSSRGTGPTGNPSRRRSPIIISRCVIFRGYSQRCSSNFKNAHADSMPPNDRMAKKSGGRKMDSPEILLDPISPKARDRRGPNVLPARAGQSDWPFFVSCKLSKSRRERDCPLDAPSLNWTASLHFTPRVSGCAQHFSRISIFPQRDLPVCSHLRPSKFRIPEVICLSETNPAAA